MLCFHLYINFSSSFVSSSSSFFHFYCPFCSQYSFLFRLLLFFFLHAFRCKKSYCFVSSSFGRCSHFKRSPTVLLLLLTCVFTHPLMASFGAWSFSSLAGPFLNILYLYVFHWLCQWAFFLQYLYIFHRLGHFLFFLRPFHDLVPQPHYIACLFWYLYECQPLPFWSLNGSCRSCGHLGFQNMNHFLLCE